MSATQVAVIAPYNVSFSPNAQVMVTYQGETRPPSRCRSRLRHPRSLRRTIPDRAGGGARSGWKRRTMRRIRHRSGSYIAMFATGEGLTTTGGRGWATCSTMPYPEPLLPVKVFVGGTQATNVVYAATAPTEVAGLFQVNIQIPPGVQPGGYVPIVLQGGK